MTGLESCMPYSEKLHEVDKSRFCNTFTIFVKELEGREEANGGKMASSGKGMPAWAESSMAARPSEPRLQKEEAQSPSRPPLDFAEPSSSSFEFISQVNLPLLNEICILQVDSVLSETLLQ